ncbi:MAG: hypothetical protein NTY10_06680 [Candidatus Omnitrophica bacterium]|nr:hypothetical protein [Candidatus Omnitrophota bacterium]
MDKYICPKCRKQLTEDSVMRCACPFCRCIFDKPDSGGETLWKSLQADMKSGHGEHIWKIGSWEEVNSDRSNEEDFFASESIIKAMQDVPMEVLAQVEVGGERFTGKGNKEYRQKIQVVSAWKWEKKYSVALAVFAAGLALQNYVQKYPKGDLMHKTIEAAKKWLENPTEENRLSANLAGSNAWSAAEEAAKLIPLSLVRSVWSVIEKAAELAIRSAAQAAWSAAESNVLSAKAAAESVALSARSAGQAAESAAEEIIQKCEEWALRHAAELKEIK